jgi:glycosyltransferase involved in cell wall biosynthesis
VAATAKAISSTSITAQPRVFTNSAVKESPSWQHHTTRLRFVPEDLPGGRVVHAARNAWIAARRTCANDILVLTDTHGLSGGLYGMMHGLREERPTLVRTDPLLTLPCRDWLVPAKIKYVRAALDAVDRIIVWAPAVIDRYVQHFGIPREKMVAQRFHHTLTGYEIGKVERKAYIFSGGDSMRDYATLIEAAKGLRMRVVIATRTKPDPSIKIPDNVRVKAVSHGEFRALMAGAYLIVFPLRTDNIRTSGQQSYLNAMALGKAVVVTDTLDAPFYIDDGKTGVLTPSGDPVALRAAINDLLDNPQKVRALGAAGKDAVLPMDQEFTWSGVLAIAAEAHAARLRR